MTLPLPLAAIALAAAQPLPAALPAHAPIAVPTAMLGQAPPATPAPVQSPAPPESAPLSAPASGTAPEAAPPPPAAVVAASQDDEIVVVARGKPPPGDPLQALNAESFKVVQAVDTALVAPIAYGYKKALPKPVRQGLHNVLQNLSEPIVFVNDLLQLHPGRAIKTLGRFVINSTVGVAGLFDLAKKKPFNLPYHVNGFGYTLGYYGVGPGPFLFLPLIGATSLRDVTGRVLDLSLVPAFVGKPFNNPYFSTGKGIIDSLDDRLYYDDLLLTIREDCPDPYAAERTWYLETRKAEIEALHNRTYDLNAKLPACLTEGMKARADARARAEAAKTPAANQAPVETPVQPATEPAPQPAPAVPQAAPAPQPAPASKADPVPVPPPVTANQPAPQPAMAATM
ncbi:MAG: VacJ family lipoprotein [Proteobacteria bacterium]|nr:VacJ family lipoprotein [Pseudomonadota bacterium]